MFDLRAAALLVLVLAAAIGVNAPGFSSASYTSASASRATVTSAVDWTPPVVTMSSVASPARDTVTLTALASDGETGVRDVTIEHSPSGADAWVTVCTATTAPWSCSWNTRSVADGTYDVRARAADGAGYTTTSASVRLTVANTTAVVLTRPADVVRGTVPLIATVTDPGSLTYSVRIESSPTGANSWKPVCTDLASPYGCSWVTTSTAYTNAHYDLRAVATSGAMTLVSEVVSDVSVDNLAPTVTMADPGTPLRGTRTFAATAADAHSGIARVTLQYARSGSSTWQVLCTLVDTPYSCPVDTSTIADGTYGFRAVASDVAGNVTTSAVVTNRVIDNTVSSVSMNDPGPLLSGTVALTASATSTAPIASVRIQYALTGGSGWTDVCTDTTSPYTCAWDTTKVADGAYDFRAILTPASGAATTSRTVTGSRVDNAPLRGVDVQTTNGGSTPGRLEADDTVTFTYSGEIDLGTVSSGWTGAARTVDVLLRDGELSGLSDRSDTLEVEFGNAAVNLGSVNLGEHFVLKGKTVTFAATMTAGTVTVNGAPRTTVTLRLGSVTSGQFLRTASSPVAMVWTPSATATGLNGKACSTAAVTESGTPDMDF